MSPTSSHQECIEKQKLKRQYVKLYNEFIDMTKWFKNKIKFFYSKYYKSHSRLVDEFINRVDSINLLLYTHIYNIYMLLHPKKKFSEDWFNCWKKLNIFCMDLPSDISELCIDDLKTINTNLEYLINIKNFTLVYQKKNYDLKIIGKDNGFVLKLKL